MIFPACKKRQAAVTPPAPGSPPSESAATPSPAKPEIEFAANPSSIRSGESASLEWRTTGATSVVIDNGVGNVNESGSVAVTPRESMTFTAVASGPGGDTSASVRVTVTEAPPGIGSSDIAGLLEALNSGKIRPVFYAYDKADLSEESKTVLLENAKWFRQFPKARILVEGHCDERGTEEYNLALGDRRAQAAYQYLRELDVNPAQMETISFGEERPFETGHTEAAFSLNRRAHFSARQP